MPSKEFNDLMQKSHQVAITLDAPRLVFVISDLQEDPTKLEDEFREFLSKTFAEELDLSFKRKSAFFVSMATAPPTLLPAKIKWNLASFEAEHLNNRWIVTIKVPLF